MHLSKPDVQVPWLGLEKQLASSNTVTSIVIDKVDQDKRLYTSKQRLVIKNQSFLFEDLLNPNPEKLPTELSATIYENDTSEQ